MAGFLKGADAVVFAAAKHLRLNATLQPIWKGGKCHEFFDEDEDEDWEGSGEHQYREVVMGDVLGDKFDAQMHDIEEDFVPQIHYQMKGEIGMKDVTWCTGDRRAWSKDHAIAAYGNEPGSTTVYSAAAITVEVPTWSKRAVS